MEAARCPHGWRGKLWILHTLEHPSAPRRKPVLTRGPGRRTAETQEDRGWAVTPWQSRRPASVFLVLLLGGTGASLPLASDPALGPPVLRGEGAGPRPETQGCRWKDVGRWGVFQHLSQHRHLAACGPRPLARPSPGPQPSGPSPFPSRGQPPARSPGPTAAARGAGPALIMCPTRPALGGRGWDAADAGLGGCPLPGCPALTLCWWSAPWPILFLEDLLLCSQNWPPACRRHTPQNPDSRVLGSPTVLNRAGCPEHRAGSCQDRGRCVLLGRPASGLGPPSSGLFLPLPCPHPPAKPGRPSQHPGPWCPPVCLHVWSGDPGPFSRLVRGPGGLSCWWYWVKLWLVEAASSGPWAAGAPGRPAGQPHGCPVSAGGEPVRPGRPPCDPEELGPAVETLYRSDCRLNH